VEKLIEERVQAKKAKNFARSDEIRKQLLEAGVILEDTKEGTRWKTEMKLETKAVHAGDRKRAPASIPVTTPIYGATTYLYESTAQLDRVMGREEEGFSYARYDNPTTVALEELMTTLESGHGALACASGMDRRPHRAPGRADGPEQSGAGIERFVRRFHGFAQ